MRGGTNVLQVPRSQYTAPPQTGYQNATANTTQNVRYGPYDGMQSQTLPTQDPAGPRNYSDLAASVDSLQRQFEELAGYVRGFGGALQDVKAAVTGQDQYLTPPPEPERRNEPGAATSTPARRGNDFPSAPPPLLSPVAPEIPRAPLSDATSAGLRQPPPRATPHLPYQGPAPLSTLPPSVRARLSTEPYSPGGNESVAGGRGGLPPPMSGRSQTREMSEGRQEAKAYKPRYPKVEEYPVFDGEPTSDFHQFIDLITSMRDALDIPDSEIIAKLHSRFTGAAQAWWREELRKPNTPRTWDEWALKIVERFRTELWKHNMQVSIDKTKFTMDDALKPSMWVAELIRKLRAKNPNIDDETLKEAVITKVPMSLRGPLMTQLQTRESMGMSLDISGFVRVFVDTITYNQGLLRLANPGVVPSSSKPSSLRPRPSKSSFRYKEHRDRNENRENRFSPKKDDNTKKVVSFEGENSGNQTNLNSSKCYSCGGTGHFANECPNKKKIPRKANVHAVNADLNDSDSTDPHLDEGDPDGGNITDADVTDGDSVYEDPDVSSSDVELNALIIEEGLNRAAPLSSQAPEHSRKDRRSPIDLGTYLSRVDPNADHDANERDYTLFLAQYDTQPEDSAPAILMYNSKEVLAPVDKAALKAFLWTTESIQACHSILAPNLDKLRKANTEWIWTWRHALEFLALHQAVTEDGKALGLHAISANESIDSVNEFARSYHSAELVRPQIPLKMVRIERPPVIEVYLNGKLAHLTVDTAASISIITKRALDLYDPNAKVGPPLIEKLNAFGTRLHSTGTYSAELVLKHPTTPLRLRVNFVVVDPPQAPVPLLLGINYVKAYGIDIVNSTGPTYIRVGSRTQKFPSVIRPPLPATIQAVAEESPSPRQIFTVQPSRQPREFREELEKAEFGPDITADELKRLKALLTEHSMNFAHGDHQLGGHTKYKLEIKLNLPDPMPAPLRKNPYPSSQRARQDMDKTLEELKRWKIIQPSKSPFSAPAVMIYRKDKPRMVVDYRALNTYTVADRYPLPRIQESLNMLAGAKYISALDANKGFHQIPIVAASQKYTAFATHQGLFEYNRMPFGLKNAPATFQRAMDDIFHAELREGWLRVYIDDILIYSPTFEKHLEHLRRALERLAPAGFTLSLPKCRFAFTELHALGHKVSGLQVAISDNHMKAVREWPPPTDRKAVQRFLGFANYHLEKVKNLAILMAPMTKLIKKTTPWNWTAHHDDVFSHVKEAIINSVALTQARHDLPYNLYVDASVGTPSEPGGLGASLTQFQNGREAVICFISRQLRGAEIRYGPTQLECLGVIWALEKCHYYLDGAKFTVICDCKALKSLLGMKTPNRHMLRWQLYIQHYRGQMTIVHRSGASHTNVDGLSRAALPNDAHNPAADLYEDDIPEVHSLETDVELHLIAVSSLSDEIFASIRLGYSDDDHLWRIYNALKVSSASPSTIKGTLPPNLAPLWDSGRFFLADDLLYLRRGLHSVLVIGDRSNRTLVISSCHDDPVSGHFDSDRTLDRVKNLAWWPGIAADVAAYVSTCDTCQRAKRATGKRHGLLIKIESPTRPWDIINMDFITELPPAGDRNYNACLVVIDRFSRRAYFIPTMDTADAKDFALLFWHNCWRNTGWPRIIISDRDPKFTSDFWQSLSTLAGIKLSMSTAYHPQTDGMVERLNQTLEDMLRRYVAFGITFEDNLGFTHDWVTVLPALEFAYNSSRHSATGRPPFELERGFLPKSPVALLQNNHSELRLDPTSESYATLLDAARSRAQESVDDAFNYAKKRWDASHTPAPFTAGDSVLLSSKNFTFQGSRKLQEPFLGPFTVLRKVGDNAVELLLTGTYARRHPVFPVSLCKLHKPGDPERFPGRRIEPPPDPVLVDGTPEWEVDQVLDEARVKDKRAPGGYLRKYKIRWKNFDSTHDTWETEDSLQHAKALLRAFRAARRSEK
jgi:transposase InsO family protein